MARLGGRDSHSSGATVARRLLATNPGSRPGNRPGQGFLPCPRCPYSVLLPVGFTHAAAVTQRRGGLLPHPFTLTPQVAFWAERSGLLSAALSLRLPSAGCYPAPCFHGARTFLSRDLSAFAAAAVRPTGACGLKRLCREGQAGGPIAEGARIYQTAPICTSLPSAFRLAVDKFPQHGHSRGDLIRFRAGKPDDQPRPPCLAQVGI